MEEADRLIGAGKKHLVMGDAVAATAALQEACDMLAKKFGDTADECGEAFFWCGRALLDLARMENTVLGNALEGIPEEEEAEEGEKSKDSNGACADSLDEEARDDLRAQVYDAMSEEKMNGEKDKTGEKKVEGESMEKAIEKEGEKMEGEKAEEQTMEKEAEKEEEKMEKAEESMEKESEKKEGEKIEDGEKKAKEKSVEEGEEKSDAEKENKPLKEMAGGVVAGASDGGENKENEEQPTEEAEEKMEEGDSGEEEGGDDEADDADKSKAGGEDSKQSDEEEEVGNLQLAWEMLEVAKIIYKRKDTKEAQLLAAQAHLKLGEVSSESGNYGQALEDLRECLALQQTHLEADSRLLAETHYQLGLAHGQHYQYGPALQHLHHATAVIHARLANLQKVINQAGDSEEGAGSVSEEKQEIEELRGLLPDLKEKVEDAQESLKSAPADTKPVGEVLNGGSAPSTFSAPSVPTGEDSSSMPVTAKPTNGVCSPNSHAPKAPVSDISHLVRKKRKQEESPVKEGVAKKVREGLKEETEMEERTNGKAVEEKLDSNSVAEGDAAVVAANKMEVEG